MNSTDHTKGSTISSCCKTGKTNETRSEKYYRSNEKEEEEEEERERERERVMWLT
jgi:hypothetical protein